MDSLVPLSPDCDVSLSLSLYCPSPPPLLPPSRSTPSPSVGSSPPFLNAAPHPRVSSCGSVEAEMASPSSSPLPRVSHGGRYDVDGLHRIELSPSVEVVDSDEARERMNGEREEQERMEAALVEEAENVAEVHGPKVPQLPSPSPFPHLPTSLATVESAIMLEEGEEEEDSPEEQQSLPHEQEQRRYYPQQDLRVVHPLFRRQQPQTSSLPEGHFSPHVFAQQVEGARFGSPQLENAFHHPGTSLPYNTAEPRPRSVQSFHQLPPSSSPTFISPPQSHSDVPSRASAAVPYQQPPPITRYEEAVPLFSRQSPPHYGAVFHSHHQLLSLQALKGHVRRLEEERHQVAIEWEFFTRTRPQSMSPQEFELHQHHFNARYQSVQSQLNQTRMTIDGNVHLITAADVPSLFPQPEHPSLQQQGRALGHPSAPQPGQQEVGNVQRGRAIVSEGRDSEEEEAPLAECEWGFRRNIAMEEEERERVKEEAEERSQRERKRGKKRQEENHRPSSSRWRREGRRKAKGRGRLQKTPTLWAIPSPLTL